MSGLIALQRAAVAVADSSAFELRRLSDSITIALLERSTQAADLTASWVGVSVGLLGVLFAVLAIGTAFTLYRQSRDFRESAEKQIASYREIVEKVAEEARLMAATVVEGIKSEAAEVTQKLNALEGEQEAERAVLQNRKEELEVRLKQLKERDLPWIGPPHATSEWAAGDWSSHAAAAAASAARGEDAVARILRQARICRVCGWNSSTGNEEPRVMRGGILLCPKCGDYLS